MSEISISTESITPELLQEVAELYDGERYKTYLWSWQFKARFGRQPLCIIARAAGQIIGFNGTMPIKLIDASGTIIAATWSCDFIVAKAYRGKGIGNAIKDEMLARFHGPIMSLGISDSAYPLLLKKGWRSPVSLSVLQYVGAPKGLKQYVFKAYSRLKKTVFSRVIKLAKNSYYCDELAELPEKNVIDYLWKLHCKDNSYTEVYRDYEYLKWRYCDYPLGNDQYHYLSVGNKSAGISALIIFRISIAENIEVVDFIGNQTDSAVVVAAASYLSKRYAQKNLITWNSSAPAIVAALSQSGFLQKSYSTRFVVRSVDVHANWNLVSGDSDGDLLKVAREEMLARLAIEENIRLGLTTEEEENNGSASAPFFPFGSVGFRYQILTSHENFLALQNDWNSLLIRSNANSLFMSWSWLYAWWSTWAEELKLQLYIVTVFDGDQLCGIIPLYRYSRYGMNCLQFIGNAWGIEQTIRSEYIAPIFVRELEQILAESFHAFFKSLPFNTQLIVPDATNNFLGNTPVIVKRVDFGYRLSTRDSFEKYLANLGGQTRLKAFNRRKYLAELGHNVGIKDVPADAQARQHFLSCLNSFHLIRWGKPCFNRHAVEFHTKVLMSADSNSPRLSYLLIDGEPVSSAYNIFSGNTLYNIQSGYVEYYDKKISLGTLHMGWGIEGAFNDPRVSFFDFLAGYGKVEDYKKHYKGDVVVFSTLKYFNSSFLCRITKILMWLKRSARQIRQSIKVPK